MKVRTPIRRQSEKAKARSADRQRCCNEVKRRQKHRCIAKLEGCTGEIADVHEKLLRSAGGDPTDPDNCIGVCRSCHNAIHANYELAINLGLRVSGRQQVRA